MLEVFMYAFDYEDSIIINGGSEDNGNCTWAQCLITTGYVARSWRQTTCTLATRAFPTATDENYMTWHSFGANYEGRIHNQYGNFSNVGLTVSNGIRSLNTMKQNDVAPSDYIFMADARNKSTVTCGSILSIWDPGDWGGNLWVGHDRGAVNTSWMDGHVTAAKLGELHDKLYSGTFNEIQ